MSYRVPKKINSVIHPGQTIKLNVAEGDSQHKYTVCVPKLLSHNDIERVKSCVRSFFVVDIYPHLILCLDKDGDKVTFNSGDLLIGGYL